MGRILKMNSPLESDLMICEFHDAIVDSVELESPDRLTLRLCKTCCYYRTMNEKIADVWICRTTLRFFGVENIVFSSLIAKGDGVSDLEFAFRDPEFHDQSNLPLLLGKAIFNARITFMSGVVIELVGGNAQLEINDRIRFLETFNLIE